MRKLFLSLLFFCWSALLTPASFIIAAVACGFLPDYMAYVALCLAASCLPIVGVAISVLMLEMLKETKDA